MRTPFRQNVSDSLRAATTKTILFIRPALRQPCCAQYHGPGQEHHHASIAYGSINNFDTVNDTSNVCHGFEIELDDIQTTDITYTYDYNHYGTPR